MKFTPGPWEVFKTNPRENGAIIPTVWNKHAQVAEVGGGNLEAIPNARLIAAAPELLGALEKIANAEQWIATNDPLLGLRHVAGIARAAIAKAKGE